jgi:hypothetical protein
VPTFPKLPELSVLCVQTLMAEFYLFLELNLRQHFLEMSTPKEKTLSLKTKSKRGDNL